MCLVCFHSFDPEPFYISFLYLHSVNIVPSLYEHKTTALQKNIFLFSMFVLISNTKYS